MSNSTAEPQAGVFAGLNPTQFNPNDPIVLFIIQVETKTIIRTVDLLT
jgi:hypothetical protein